MRTILLVTAAIGFAASAHASGMLGFNGTVGAGSGIEGTFGTTNGAKAFVGEIGAADAGGVVTGNALNVAATSVTAVKAMSTPNAFTTGQFENFADFNGALVGQTGF